MKNLTLLALLALFTACNKEITQPYTPTDSVAQKEAAKPLAYNNLPEEFGGLWISDSYLSNVERTKSIYASRQYTTSMLGFSFYKNFTTMGGFSEHEGGIDWPVKYSAATNRFTYDISRKADYQQPQQFALYTIGKDKLEIAHTGQKKTEQYRRIAKDSTNIGALNYELNRILFEGSYNDSLSGNRVTFGRKGQLTGIKGKTVYDLVFDYAAGAYEYDVVSIADRKPHTQATLYHFKIKDSTIYIYGLTEVEDEFEYSINPKPVYVLKKDKI